MQCPYCDSNLSDYAKFCSKCGRSIIRCPKCQRVITRKTNFCPVDGTKIDQKFPDDLPVRTPKRISPKPIEQTVESKHLCKKCGMPCKKNQSLCSQCKNRKYLIYLISVITALILIVGGILIGIAVSSKNTGNEDDLNVAPISNSDVENNSSHQANPPIPPENSNVDDDDDEPNEYIEETAFEIASRYSDNVIEFDNHAYAIFNFKDEHYSSYDECAEFCNRMGGHLAVINSSSENEMLYQFIRDSGLHLAFFGYSDQEYEGEWKWIEGNSTYTNWGEGQPNNGAKNKGNRAENYAEFSKANEDGTWNDAPFGSNTYHFICEWE